MKEHQKKDGNILRKNYTHNTNSTNLHTQHIVVRKSVPPPLKTRESNITFVWGDQARNNIEHVALDNILSKNTILFAFMPADDQYVDEDEMQKVKAQRQNSRKRAKKRAAATTYGKRMNFLIGRATSSSRGK